MLVIGWAEIAVFGAFIAMMAGLVLFVLQRGSMTQPLRPSRDADLDGMIQELHRLAGRLEERVERAEDEFIRRGHLPRHEAERSYASSGREK